MMAKSRNRVASFILSSIFFYSCATSDRISLQQAAIEGHDVFTCKGLTQDQRWVGVSDVFLPEVDPQVVVVAAFNDEDKKNWISYELINPLDTIVIKDDIHYPKSEYHGVEYSMDRLMALGGEGEWRATVYSNGEPIGQQIFYLGEKPEPEEEDEGTTYFIVGEDSLETVDDTLSTMTDEERFGSYIREVSPEVEIPVNSETILEEPVSTEPAPEL